MFRNRELEAATNVLDNGSKIMIKGIDNIPVATGSIINYLSSICYRNLDQALLNQVWNN